jgi:uncharacterized RDD family membrane protein YckC
LEVPDNVLAIVQNRELMHNLDAAFFRVGAATIRTLLRIVDALLTYLVAFIAVLSTDKRQRLEDVAAHTLVIHNK